MSFGTLQLVIRPPQNRFGWWGAGAVTLAQAGAGSDLERAYGGSFGLRRVLEEQLLKADALALELARAAACLAGTCILPVANDPIAKP